MGPRPPQGSRVLDEGVPLVADLDPSLYHKNCKCFDLSFIQTCYFFLLIWKKHLLWPCLVHRCWYRCSGTYKREEDMFCCKYIQPLNTDFFYPKLSNLRTERRLASLLILSLTDLRNIFMILLLHHYEK